MATQEGKGVRHTLSALRQRWDQHTPVYPMFLSEELSPDVTIAEFCVTFLLLQRSRRGGLAVSEMDDGPSDETIHVESRQSPR